MDCPLYDLVSACLLSFIYPWFPDFHSHCPVHYDSTTVIFSSVSLPHHWKCSFLCQKPPPPSPSPPTHNSLPNSWEKNKWKVRVLVAWWCPTLCDPMDYISPGSSVLGILQTRILQWGSHSLLQGIFSTQGLNPVSRIAVYRLGYQGSPYLCSKHRWKFLSLVPSFTSFPPLKCPIYSTSSLSRPFVSTQLQCILLLFLLKIYILPKAMPVARDISMNSAIKVVIIIELTLARGQDSLLQDIPHWHIILHWSHSWCGATCVFNKTAAATTILQPSSFPWKQEINRPCWRYPPYTNILITRDREFKAKKPV